MDWVELSTAEKEAARLMAWESLAGFTRVMFRFVLHTQFQVNWHHIDIFRVCEDAYFGRSIRDILNIAPGGTKTETVAVHFPAWAMLREYERARSLRKSTGTRHPLSTRWLELAYSSDLVGKSTGRILDIVQSEVFQYMMPNTTDPKRGAQSDWRIIDAEGGTHEVYGVSLLGQVTGNRAGFLREGFSGALIVDDPMPPRDERSFAKKDQINRNLNRVVRNRLQHPKVPIMMIQQRISSGDQTDFLRSAKSLDTYRLTKIPALVTPKIAKAMPLERRARMVESTGYKGEPISYWESQVDTQFLLTVQENDAFLFTSQYQQAPDEAMLEGVIFAKEMARLIADGRNSRIIGLKPHIPVDSYWDKGISVGNDMAVTLAQTVGVERWIIGHTHEHDVGLEHFLIWMMDFKKLHPWIRWGRHFGPHDLRNRNAFTARSDRDVAKEIGIEFEPPVERPLKKRDAIEASRRIFPVLRIDEEATKVDLVRPDPRQEDRWLWAALQKYHRKWDAENEVFQNEPAHDWASNPVDSFMLIGLTYRAEELQQEQPAQPAARSFWGR